MRNYIVSAAVLASALTLPSTVSAQELVTNGGFETGDFSGWTQGGNTGNTGVSSFLPNSGNFAADLGPVGAVGTLSQLLNTIAGETYAISFWLQSDGGTPNSFQASFGGNPLLLNLSNSGAFQYFNFTFTADADDAPTLLEFTFQQDPAYWTLDDVSVQGAIGPIPEPATWAMMITGFGVIGGALRRRRKVNVSFATA